MSCSPYKSCNGCNMSPFPCAPLTAVFQTPEYRLLPNQLPHAGELEYYTTPKDMFRQAIQKFSGLREGCEDTICPCSEYSHDSETFKKCKVKCFQEKQKDIQSCCALQCPMSADGKTPMTDCALACSTALTYEPTGGDTLLIQPTTTNPMNPRNPAPNSPDANTPPADTSDFFERRKIGFGLLKINDLVKSPYTHVAIGVFVAVLVLLLVVRKYNRPPPRRLLRFLK